MRKTFFLSLFVSLFASSLNAFEVKGRLNTWSLYITDDFDISSVIDVYENASCDAPGEVIERVFGKERAAITDRCESTNCCIERVVRGDEIIAERVYESGGEILRDEGAKAGDTLLMNIGTDLKAKQGHWDFQSKGNMTYSALEERTLTGDRTYRFRFTDVYAQYEDTDSNFAYRTRLGRHSILAGALVDGASFDYYFGNKATRTSKSVGVFVGLMPHPITKHIDLDFRTFGATFHYIPEFANSTGTKLRVDSAVVGEVYKSDMHRAYLFTRSHFSPFAKLSLFHYSTIDLPASGDDGGISSNHFSFNIHYRPSTPWFVAAGISQFKIDRLLKERIVGFQDELSNNPTAAERVGTTLDRSHRYRFDLRASYKPVPLAQPYVKLRYERRTFDGNKTSLNQNTDTPLVAPPENLSLVDKKNAYQGSFGIRFFPMIQLETDSSFTFLQRYQSRAYDLYQSVVWDNGDFWTVNGFGQVLWNSKKIRNTNPSLSSTSVNSMDFYLGVGGSLKFMTDFLAHFSYDFAHEDDYELERSIIIHSLWARLDYRF